MSILHVKNTHFVLTILQSALFVVSTCNFDNCSADDWQIFSGHGTSHISDAFLPVNKSNITLVV